jgi:excisionase family DNA binding protein
MRLTPKEAARRAGVSLSLVYAWVKAGTLPHSRFGRPGSNRGAIRIDEEEFDTFLRTMRVTRRPIDDAELRWLK